MSSPIAIIEKALVAQLKDVQRPYQGLTVESYAGQLDDELFGWIRTLPACWVTFDGAQKVEKIGRRSYRVSATFEVLTAQRALQENAQRLAPADGLTVGVYEVIEDNKLAIVQGGKLGLAISPFVPGAVRAVMKSMVNRDAIAVYAQQFRTSWVEEIPDAPATPDGVLQLVGLNYLLKPGDDLVDSSDLITTLDN